MDLEVNLRQNSETNIAVASQRVSDWAFILLCLSFVDYLALMCAIVMLKRFSSAVRNSKTSRLIGLSRKLCVR